MDGDRFESPVDSGLRLRQTLRFGSQMLGFARQRFGFARQRFGSASQTMGFGSRTFGFPRQTLGSARQSTLILIIILTCPAESLNITNATQAANPFLNFSTPASRTSAAVCQPWRDPSCEIQTQTQLCSQVLDTIQFAGLRSDWQPLPSWLRSSDWG